MSDAPLASLYIEPEGMLSERVDGEGLARDLTLAAFSAINDGQRRSLRVAMLSNSFLSPKSTSNI